VKRLGIVLAVAAALVASLLIFRGKGTPPVPVSSPASAEVSGSAEGWTVRVRVDEADQLAAFEPVLLILDVRNDTAKAVQIDSVGLADKKLELEVVLPSGTAASILEGLGDSLRGHGGVEIAPGAGVTYYEAFLPDESGTWVVRLKARIIPQDLTRTAVVVELPSLTFQVKPAAPAIPDLIRSDQLDSFLLGRWKFLDMASEGEKIGKLEAAASPRLRRFVALAKGMTLAFGHRYGFRKEDEEARRILEEVAKDGPGRPLTDVALLGLAKIYSTSRPFSELTGDTDRDSRELVRVADQLRRDFPSSSVTRSLLGLYDQR